MITAAQQAPFFSTYSRSWSDWAKQSWAQWIERSEGRAEHRAGTIASMFPMVEAAPPPSPETVRVHVAWLAARSSTGRARDGGVLITVAGHHARSPERMEAAVAKQLAYAMNGDLTPDVLGAAKTVRTRKRWKVALATAFTVTSVIGLAVVLGGLVSAGPFASLGDSIGGVLATSQLTAALVVAFTCIPHSITELGKLSKADAFAELSAAQLLTSPKPVQEARQAEDRAASWRQRLSLSVFRRGLGDREIAAPTRPAPGPPAHFTPLTTRVFAALADAEPKPSRRSGFRPVSKSEERPVVVADLATKQAAAPDARRRWRRNRP